MKIINIIPQKRCFWVFILIFTLLPLTLFAQAVGSAPEAEQPGTSVPAKFALVIGNGSYSGGLSRIANPVNDADDIADALESLGFTVDKLLDASQEQMENGVILLKERLSVSADSYGFFFYAGHGVQSAGENYLIPVDASIPSENFLRSRALQVQAVLDELNDAGNSLNVVVLDACRDNPFGWSRSGSRGLMAVNRQPVGSIIVYATSAGAKASDGEGRNGLFTGQLLKNLTVPGIEVKEIFNRTGADVSEVSHLEQVPAVYNQFFGTAYFGEKPEEVSFSPPVVWPAYEAPPEKERDPSQFWSIGASAGTSFAEPWLIGTLRGTIAPLKYSFIELGLDLGFVSGVSDVGYYSFYPFIHAAFFWPFISNKLGAYAGAGGGFMWASYSFPDFDTRENSFALDAVLGVSLFDMIDISYTLRTNFKNVSGKVSVGYTYRF